MLQSFFLHTHLILLRIASLIGVWLGTIIIRMKRPKTLDLRNIRTFHLNRSDRIGDAIISRPFIKLLIAYLRDHGCTADIVILTSRYNHFLLEELQDEKNKVYVREEPKEISDYESKLSRMIRKHVNFLYKTLMFRWTHGNKRDETSLFFDMGGGDLITILKYKELHNSVIAGPNIFWGSHILDIALEHSYVHYANQNLIESYMEIVTKIFGLDNSFRDFVCDHMEAFYEYDPDAKRSGICLFVGVKEFRNLPVTTWRRIIHEVAAAFPEEAVTVLDDNTNLLYGIFSQEKFPSNVRIGKNTYSLQEFVAYIARFAFVVGIDGGGINMVKSLTNSCFINTFAQPNVWSGFTGKCPRIVTE